MAQFVFKYNNIADVEMVNPTSASVTQTNWSPLIMPRGVYQYNSLKYDFDTDGLYGIINLGVDGGWRIIYQSDIYALISGLCWLTTYGRMDAALSLENMAIKAKGTKLSLQCGNTIDFVRYCLTGKSITSRICRLLTADTPNNYDDGHVALEVNIGGNWKFWDIANNYYPEYNSNHLNLKDYFVNYSSVNKVYVADGERDINGAGSYVVHTPLVYDMLLRTSNNLENWVDRIYGIPGIVHTDGKTYFYMPSGTESRQSWVEGLSSSYVVVSYAAWLSMFY